MKVVVFGASGRTGRELLQQGIVQGFRITAFARRPEKLPVLSPAVRVVCGDIADHAKVEGAISGHSCVICAVGTATHVRQDPKLVLGIHNIIVAMETLGVKRLIYLSNDSVSDLLDRLNPFRRYLIRPLFLKHLVVDHETNETMIRQSHLEWTIVRPPTLTQGQRVGVYRSGEDTTARSPFPHISRADIAEFMLKQVTETAYIRRLPVVMY